MDFKVKVVSVFMTPPSKKVTQKDIADRLGFSINTVSRALRKQDHILPETLSLIENTAKEMGYIPNIIASAMRSGRTRSIGIILEDISNPYFGIMVKYLDRYIRKKGYCTILYGTDGHAEKEEDAIQTAVSNQVAGVILFPTSRSPDALKALQDNKIPFVLIDRFYEGATQMNYVVYDNIRGGYLATRYLIEKGHRDILLFRGPPYISCAMSRYLGYVQAMAEFEIPIHPRLLMQCGVWNVSSRDALEQVMRNKIPFTGIVTFSDKQAWMAQKLISEAADDLYQHIDIVGFDHLRNELFYAPDIPSIDVNKDYVAKRATHILFQHIFHPDSAEYVHETVDVKLAIPPYA